MPFRYSDELSTAIYFNGSHFFFSFSDYTGTCLESTKGGCEHYCLNVTSGKGYSCACYTGYEINADNSKKCEGE